MRNKVKNIVVTSTFIAIIIIIFLLNLIIEDTKVSKTERRALAQFPEITTENLLNGKISDKFENYAVDQFIGRDFFKNIKSLFSINVFNQKDNNKLFKKDGAIYKMEYPLNENNIAKSADKINEIYNKYLQSMNVYYAIIPEKNYYLENDDHLIIDYNKLKEIMSEKIENIQYIDIWNELSLEDFYKTDIHWKQENLDNVVSKIETSMNLKNISKNIYQIEDVGDFYGTYYGQIAGNIKPDRMYILNSETIRKCNTYNYETEENNSVYDRKITNDKYDIYLSGATPLIVINNPESKSEKELLLFRDSFGSSIAPLLIENYKKITLIDIRYMSNNLLDKYIEFYNQDVLFLYSSIVLNQNILK